MAVCPSPPLARLAGTVTRWGPGDTHAAAQGLGAGSTVRTGSAVATAADARVALRTFTGHSLRLDRDTRIVVIAGDEIRLEQGAVYIDSGSGGEIGRALVVSTAFGRVEEVGTRFEVRLAADSLTVSVRDGEVRVDTEGRELRAQAGEQLSIAGAGVRRATLAPYDGLFEWTQDIAPAWEIDGSALSGFPRLGGARGRLRARVCE